MCLNMTCSPALERLALLLVGYISLFLRVMLKMLGGNFKKKNPSHDFNCTAFHRKDMMHMMARMAQLRRASDVRPVQHEP